MSDTKRTKKRKKSAVEKYGKNKFSYAMQKKLVLLVIIVILALLGLGVRIYMLMRDNGDRYKKQILSQQEYKSNVIPYKRGNIVDTNGTILATSEKVYNVIIDSKAILAKEEYLDPSVNAIATCFDVPESDIRSYIQSHENSQYYVLKRKLSYDCVAKYEAIVADKENNPYVTGVWFETEYQRVYPRNTLACDLIGFTTGMDGDGMYGLEQYYNEELSGKNGREYGYLNEDLTLERTTVPAEDGYTLVTTIDANIQSIVERNLKNFNDAHANEYRDGLGAYNTGCIIMRPDSGEILAMASFPTFDLNNPYDLSAIYTEEEIEALTDEEFTTAVNNLWQNFCITSTYEPGSTQKPFTVATGIETGVLGGDETYFCPGYLQVANYQIHCHNRYGCGTISVKEAIQGSCNVALMKMGQEIGKKNFLKYMNAFNFGLRTNIDLSGESRTDALVFTDKTMNETELATASFGQGQNVTMIQLITAYCSLINGGYYYQPHVVRQILNADGAVVETIEPRVLKQTVSGTTSAKILEYCNAVVEDGTGKAAKPTGYTMGGKTGTAEMVPRNEGNFVVSFIGYVPNDNPEVVIYVVIDRANQAKQDNSKLASMLVHDIMTEVLPYMGIEPTEELSDEQRQEISDTQTGYLYELNENSDTGEDAGTDENEGNESSESESQKLEIKYDPETGYAIDPLTGEFLDPKTGEPIDPTSPTMIEI